MLSKTKKAGISAALAKELGYGSRQQAAAAIRKRLGKLEKRWAGQQNDASSATGSHDAVEALSAGSKAELEKHIAGRDIGRLVAKAKNDPMAAFKRDSLGGTRLKDAYSGRRGMLARKNPGKLRKIDAKAKAEGFDDIAHKDRMTGDTRYSRSHPGYFTPSAESDKLRPKMHKAW